MISLLGDYLYEFPKPFELKLRLKDMLENEVDDGYYWNNKTIYDMRKMKVTDIDFKWNIKVKEFIYNSKIIENETYSLNAYNKTFSTISHTITTPHNTLFIFNKNKIRKPTPKECWRLMGLSDTDFDKAKASGVSNSQLYKQAGNGIVVNVLMAIFKNLI